MSFNRDPDLGLFNDNDAGIEIALEDALLHYYSAALGDVEADALMQQCLTDIPWQQDYIHIAGKRIAIPRLQCWFGDVGTDYSYSNINLIPQPWPEFILVLKTRLEALTAHTFNCALANLYRNGCDSVDWHSDDEPELGDAPIIASLSLGASRVFELKHRTKSMLKARKIALHHGSVLVMKGATQRHWRHRIAKVKALQQARVNITFRRIENELVKC